MAPLYPKHPAESLQLQDSASPLLPSLSLPPLPPLYSLPGSRVLLRSWRHSLSLAVVEETGRILQAGTGKRGKGGHTS